MVDRPVAIALLLLCVIFVSGAGYFAAHQAIWIDETTQLSGLALPYGEQLRWLLGQSELRLGVPADRMPPLSYWLGSLWGTFFGVSEMSMRWFGITAVAVAVPALYMAGRLQGGALGGLFVVAFVLLAPNTLIIAGEIRAYPLFLALSAWSVWAFLRCLDPAGGDRIGRLLTLSVFLALSAYTHFFGVVLAGTLFFALLIMRVRAGAGVLRVLGAGLATGVSFVGLAPFVLAALSKSAKDGPDEVTSVMQVAENAVRLVLRLFLHGSHSVYPVALFVTAIALLGLAALLLLGSARAADTDRRPASQSLALFIPLMTAGLALPVLDLLIGGFEVLAPHYNLWMLPVAAVLLSGAFAAGSVQPWLSQGAKVLGAAVLLGHAVASFVLLRNATLYSHGPGEWVYAQWQEAPDHAIIHDSNGLWAHAYFPVHYLSGGAAVQILARPDGSLARIRPTGFEPISGVAAVLSAQEGLLLVRVENKGSEALAQIARGDRACRVAAPGDGQQSELVQFCAFSSASVARVAGQDD